MFRRVYKFFGIDKIVRSISDINTNGGVGASLKKLYRMENFKAGRLVGEDKYGNKYYEDPTYFFGRHRWVEYAEYRNLEYDASQVPAEWHRWLHSITDFPPRKDTPIATSIAYKWILDHSENLSGTKDAYMPYSTTKSKIEAWKPNENQ
jgi:NADH:ubiquinone oxidoreductase subunit